MKAVQGRVKSIRTFWDEVVSETKKSTWPTRQELIESTVVVIVTVLLLGLFVGVSDKALVSLLKLLINAG